MTYQELAKLFAEVAEDFSASNFHHEAAVLDAVVELMTTRPIPRVAKLRLWREVG